MKTIVTYQSGLFGVLDNGIFTPFREVDQYIIGKTIWMNLVDVGPTTTLLQWLQFIQEEKEGASYEIEGGKVFEGETMGNDTRGYEYRYLPEPIIEDVNPQEGQEEMWGMVENLIYLHGWGVFMRELKDKFILTHKPK